MRGWTLGAFGLALAGCASNVPQSNVLPEAGVGFGDYAAFELERARREAALTGAPVPGAAPTLAAPTLVPAPAAPVPPGGIAPTELAAAGIGVAPVTTGTLAAGPATPIAPMTGAPQVLTAASLGATPPPVVTPAVPSAAPTTLAGLPATPPASLPATAPAAALPAGPLAAAAPAAQPAWNPQADPLRGSGLEAQPGNAAPVLVSGAVAGDGTAAGPNIVEYALAAPNARGQEWYSRFAFSGQGRADRNCASYRTADDAQRDFLANGGPERDRRGIDPDGDGFACAWDPAPFRAAVGRG